MADLRGRCKNVEYCSIATSQKIVTLPEDVPFDCPKCGEPLEPLQVAQRGRRNRTLLVVQVLVMLVGGGAVAYKLLGVGAAPTGAGTQAVTASSPELAMPTPQATDPAPAPSASVTTPPPPAVAPPSLPIAAPAAAPQILLRLAGSNVMADKLAHRLAAGYLGLIGDTDITLLPGSGSAVVVTGNQAGQREGIGIAPGA